MGSELGALEDKWSKKWPELDGRQVWRERLLGALRELDAEHDKETAQLRAELEAYKRAKAENGERFMGERDKARAELEEARGAVQDHIRAERSSLDEADELAEDLKEARADNEALRGRLASVAVNSHGKGQEDAEEAIGMWLAEQGADDVADKVMSGEWRAAPPATEPVVRDSLTGQAHRALTFADVEAATEPRGEAPSIDARDVFGGAYMSPVFGPAPARAQELAPKTFDQLVHRVGPLPTTGLASAEPRGEATLSDDWFCSVGCQALVRDDVRQGRCLGCGFIPDEEDPATLTGVMERAGRCQKCIGSVFCDPHRSMYNRVAEATGVLAAQAVGPAPANAQGTTEPKKLSPFRAAAPDLFLTSDVWKAFDRFESVLLAALGKRVADLEKKHG